MSSGVLVNPQCQTVFQQLSEGKRTLRYIIYKIEDKEVVVEAAVSSEEVGHRRRVAKLTRLTGEGLVLGGGAARRLRRQLQGGLRGVREGLEGANRGVLRLPLRRLRLQ